MMGQFYRMVITLSKIVRKWRPDDYWRIGEHESWFQDMALEGLHLKDIGYRMAKFEKGEPKKTKYRIRNSRLIQHTA